MTTEEAQELNALHEEVNRLQDELYDLQNSSK